MEESLFPTWLHFAANHGLEQLVTSLLAVSGNHLAVLMPNAANLTPAGLAQKAGHFKLAEYLEGLAVSVLISVI